MEMNELSVLFLYFGPCKTPDLWNCFTSRCYRSFFFFSFKIFFRLKGPVVAFVNATIGPSIFLAWAIVVFLKHCYRSKEPFFPIAIFRRFYSDILKHCANSSIFKGLQQCFNNVTIGLGLIRSYRAFCKTLLLQGLLKIKKILRKKFKKYLQQHFIDAIIGLGLTRAYSGDCRTLL